MKILFFTNSVDNILNYRLNLINYLVKKGFKIEILLPKGENIKKLFFLKLKIYTIDFDPRSLNFFLDIILIFKIYKAFKSSRPDLILQFTIKPVIYGSIVSRLLKLNTINTITGLGSTFFNKHLSKLIFYLYYFSQKKVKKIIFQNNSDQNIFLKNNIVKKSQCVIVNGSGFDAVKFKLTSLPNKNVTTFALVSRILKEKGIIEYIRAAEELKNIYKKKVKFLLVGKLKKDNFFLDKKIIINANNKGIIQYFKETTKVQKIIKKIHCLVLPSYREGFSKILMEASSMGRPLIATKVPGCKEIVKNNMTGYLCQSKNYKSLIYCMEKIINSDISKLSKMGVAGSKYVRINFSDKKVINKIYKLIIKD
jgi:glycosyltransferase involved in cell wall biosynthesis